MAEDQGSPRPPPRPSSRTAADRRIEVKQAIGVASTAPGAHGEALQIDPGLRLRQY